MLSDEARVLSEAAALIHPHVAPDGGDADIPTLVRAVYIGLDPRLAGAAALSTLAHLEDLVARGIVATDGAASIDGAYRLAGA